MPQDKYYASVCSLDGHLKGFNSAATGDVNRVRWCAQSLESGGGVISVCRSHNCHAQMAGCAQQARAQYATTPADLIAYEASCAACARMAAAAVSL